MRAVPIKIDWHSDLSIYASEPFLKAVGDEYGWLGGMDGAGNLRCILPFTILCKPLFRLVRFRIETIPLNGGLTIAEEQAFLNDAIKYFRERRADIIIPPTTNTIFRTYPDGAEAAPYGTYIVDLTQPEEILWNQLSSSHRRKIRLAKKSEVKIKEGLQYLAPVYRLVRDTFRRSRLGFLNYSAFERQVVGLGEYVKVWIAEQNGKIQGGMVTPFSRHSAYYVYGGSIPEPAAGAMNSLHWHAIQSFREHQVKFYDFVGARIDPDKGSKQEGLAIFKERFGGQLVRGYIWKYKYHSVKYLLYNAAVRLTRHGDIVDQERRRLGLRQITNISDPLVSIDRNPVATR